ncbi:MAG: ethanolamine utilization protein EutH [Brevinemataceae bacterium]
MSINEIIIYLMVIFMFLGGLDKIYQTFSGKSFGLAEQFNEGILAMGTLALAMIGAISIAPVLGNILLPVVGPVYQMLGADPAMFATTLLANDMGGYPLAMALAKSEEVGKFAGLILGAMFGPTIVFTIPVALGIIKVEDRKYLAQGCLAGIITIPLGSLVGGLLAGLPISIIGMNLIPVVIVAALIVLGLILIPNQMISGFIGFGKFVIAIITFALIASITETLTGFVIIPGMAPISEGIEVVGAIAIVLAGAFPLVYVITKIFNKPLMSFGKLLNVNETSAAGFIATLANNIPMFTMMKDMDNRGKIINTAFAVSASFVFGDHLGFTAGIDRTYIGPMIAGKLVGGVTAVVVAYFLTKNMDNQK